MNQQPKVDKQSDLGISDESLMLVYSNGDASAFEQLYQRHKQVVFRFFTKQCPSIAIAEELCHDTWLKLINHHSTYKVNAQFKTYLFTIARNILIDYRQKKSTTNEENTHSNIEDTIAEKSLTTENLKLVDALAKNIDALPPNQRDVFLLKQEAGFTIEQIAKITAQQKEQVKSSWRYALQRLRKGLSHYV